MGNLSRKCLLWKPMCSWDAINCPLIAEHGTYVLWDEGMVQAALWLP